MASDGVALGIGVALLAGNAFFVAAEFAVVSARRAQIEPRAEAGGRMAKITLSAMEQVSLMLAMCQLGITMCSLGLGAIAEPAVHHLIHTPLHALGVPDSLSHPLSFALALTLVAYLHVVVGEMIPKNVSLAIPERAALVLAPALMGVAQVFKPLIVVMNAIANVSIRMFGVQPKDEVASTYTAEEVHSIVTESSKEGLLGDDTVVRGALEFSDQSARDVMVPLSDLVGVKSSSTPAELEDLVTTTGFSRFPVLDERGELKGYLHLKDVLYADESERNRPVQPKRLRSLVTVRDIDEVEEALALMQNAGAHLGRVVTSQGKELGVIFMEDVLEQLVGEIADESGVVGRPTGGNR